MRRSSASRGACGTSRKCSPYAGRQLADLAQETGAALLAAVDTVITAALDRAKVSAEATVLAWAGGALLIRQADRALEVLGAGRQQDDPWVARSATLARLTDPASPRLKEQVDALADRTRHQLAAAVLEEAVNVARDPDATLVERVIARQAAHHVRDNLDARGQLTQVQCALIRGLEKLGDTAAAYQVATEALAGLPADDQGGKDRREILEAVLRLVRTRPRQDQDPLIEEAVALALTGGAVLGLEARVWAAVDLLDRPGRREAALKLADQVTAELAQRPSTEATANQWRLLLAFHVGRAGYPAISQRLLTPMINTAATAQQEAAQKILYAIGGPRADTRLQIILLEAELADRPQATDDDLLRLHNALAADYDTLGDHRSALQHGSDELALRHRLQGPDHRQTLTARAQVAHWTGHCGDSAQALRLCQELLPDQVRVLGPDHPDTLNTRTNIAFWTGQHGDSAQALRLCQELLPDQVRVLGPDHPQTLNTRANIAGWTGQHGDSAQALRLYQELLPDQVRVLGPDHPNTLKTRGNIAGWTGQHGDSAQALRLYQELLPDQVRVLGRDNPETLKTRFNVAILIAECGDSTQALRLYQELLPDQVRVLGRDHPETLFARANIAGLADRHGDSAQALRLYQELLPDQVRVLGRDHPDTLRTRAGIAFSTGECGDSAQALRLYQELLPDQVRVLDRDHPDTLRTRRGIALWTGECGDSAQALRMGQELLPDQVRVLGRDHPDTLTTRAGIALWTGECGDSAQALRLCQELLPDLVRVLGPDHPDTLGIRQAIAHLAGES